MVVLIGANVQLASAQAFKNITTQQVDLLISQFDDTVDVDKTAALALVERALDYAEVIKYEKGLIRSYISLAYLHYLLNENSQAYNEVHKGLDQIKSPGDYPAEYMRGRNLLGVVCKNLGRYEEAMQNYLRLLEFAKLKDSSKYINSAMNNIGIIYAIFGNYAKAISYYKSALEEIRADSTKLLALMNAYHNIAESYFHLSSFYSALNYQDSVFQIVKKHNISDYQIPNALHLMASIYYELNLIDSTFNYLNRAAEVNKIINNSASKAQNYALRAQLNADLNNKELARAFVDSANFYLLKLEKVDFQLHIYKMCAEVSEKLQDQTKAYYYLKQYTQLKDSISAQTNEINIEVLQEEFERKLLEKQNILNQAKADLEKQQLENKQRLLYFLLVLSGFIVLASIVVFLQSAKIKKFNKNLLVLVENKTKDLKLKSNELEDNNEKLVRANKELDRFVYSASHDLRAPLANIMGLIQLSTSAENWDEVQHYLSLMAQTATKMDALISDLVNYSKNQRAEMIIEPVKLDQLVIETINTSKSINPKIKFNTSLSMTTPTVNTDALRVSIILSNLVSNAINYADAQKEEPWVKIGLEINPSDWKLIVADNGIGISPLHLPKIFDMYYRAQPEASEGTGLGLYLVQDAVEKLNGKIGIESKINEGTTFTITFPLDIKPKG